MTDPGGRDGGAGGDGSLRHTYDWEVTRPSAAVVEMVAIAADREPFGLQPLFDAIDPEALDALVASDGTERAADTFVSLRYAGHDVTVRSDGEVAVSPTAADGGRS